MLNESRIDIYNYLYGLLFGVVSENVYSMNEPQELTQSDTEDGFIVIHVGDMVDVSEFYGETYGMVRCFVEAFIPPMSRGRLDIDKYKTFEDSLNEVIKSASENQEGDYYIDIDNVISFDADEVSNADNAYFTFIKSFIVVIDKQE